MNYRIIHLCEMGDTNLVCIFCNISVRSLTCQSFVYNLDEFEFYDDRVYNNEFCINCMNPLSQVIIVHHG